MIQMEFEHCWDFKESGGRVIPVVTTHANYDTFFSTVVDYYRLYHHTP